MNLKKLFLGALVLGMIAAGSASAATYNWTTSLKLGSKGSQVMDLQKFLNMYPAYQVSTSGAGSPGMETSYFGPATKAAVMKFQAANGITPVAGFFGPVSRAAAVAIQNGSTPTNSGNLPAGCTSTGGFSPVTGQPCTATNTSQTGSVMASLASSNPASGYIIDGQATAGLLDVTFTGTGIVNSVTLQRSGISDQNTLTNVYLYDGATRLTDGYSFNSASQITMSNLNLMVNGSRTISVRADAASNASEDSTIAAALVGFTSGTSVNTVNIKGNDMFLAAGSSLATASLSANTVSSGNVNAGVSAYTLWSAPIQVNTRAVSLKSAAFRMVGSAPSDAISNIKMFVDGLDTGVTATISSINGSNYAVFNFMSMPKSLSTGSHTLDVRGNIEKGSSRTVQFSLQQAADLMIFDPQVGVNLAVTGTVPNSAGTITINSGSVTANIDPTFQSLTTVTGGASNVAIAKFKLRGYGEDVKVSSIQVLPVFTVNPIGVDGLDDVTLYFNGSQVGSQQDWTSGNLTFTLGSQMIVPAGVDSSLEVRANIRDKDGSPNYTDGSVSANLVVGSSNAQGQTSFTSLNTPAVTGNILTIQAGVLAVSSNTGFLAQSANPNTSGVKIGSFTLQNQSSSESVRVTSLAVNVAYGSGVDSTNFSSLRTSESSGSGATPQQLTTAAASGNGTNTFSVDFTVAPGAIKTIDVYADSGSDTTGTVTTLTSLTVTSLGATSNVSIQQNGNGTAVAGPLVTYTVGTLGAPTLVTASATAAQYIAAGGGASDATKASYNFVSSGGAATISELKFTVTGANTVTSVKVGNVSASPVNNVAYLTGLNLAVPNGGSGLTQDVFISYSSVGTGGISPATTSAVALTEVKYSSGGTTDTDTVSVSAPTMVMVGSKPSVAVTTTTNIGLNLGAENKIGEITISADAKGNIKLNDIQFAIGSTGFTTVPTFTAARLADGTTTIPGTGCGQGTAAAVSQTIFCEFGTSGNTFTTTTATTGVEVNTDFDGYTIAAGTSKTFSLYATVSAANTGTNSASISSSLVAAGLNWDDTSFATFVADGSAASPSAGTNLTGASIYNFPTGSYTVKQY